MTIIAPGSDLIHILGSTDGTEIGNVSDSLKANVTNFPATQAVTQSTSPWVVSQSGIVSVRQESQNQCVLGNAYSLIITSLVANTALTNLVYINNPNTNTQSLILTSLYLAQSSSGANNWIDFTFYKGPTVTVNGTGQTPVNQRIGSANVSAMSVFSGPTVSSTGTIVQLFPNGNNNGASPGRLYVLDPYLILAPNQKLLLAGAAKANNVPIDIVLNWFEAVI